MSDRILIIDDEEHIRRMMRLTLEVAGYEIGEAKDGQEGVSLYGDGLAGRRSSWIKECREWMDWKHCVNSKDKIQTCEW